MSAGRYYRITPRFWQDPDVRNEWTEDMRLLAIYLMTSPHRNMVGLYYCPLSYIENDLQWKSNRLRLAFDSLSSEAVDFIRYDHAAQVVFLVNGLKHDSPTTPKQVTGAVNILRNLPRTKLLNDLLSAAEMECECLANAIRMQFDCESVEVRVPDTVPRTPYPDNRTPESAIADTLPTDVGPLPDAIASLWNEVCGNTLPKVTKLTASRRTHVRARLREKGRDLDWWRAYLGRIIASPFLIGENDRGWKADFDWATSSEDNVTKVLEGRYDRKRPGPTPIAPADKPAVTIVPYEPPPGLDEARAALAGRRE